jgi:hypothetical protein
MQRSPAAENPGSNDDNVRFRFHFEFGDGETFGLAISLASFAENPKLLIAKAAKKIRKDREELRKSFALFAAFLRALCGQSLLPPAQQLSSKTFPFASKMMDG